MAEQPKYQALYEWRAALFSATGPAMPLTRLILDVLSMWANEKLEAYPRQTEIAKRAGVSVRAVRMHLKLAERDGWIVRKRMVKPGNKWQHCTYTLKTPRSDYQIPFVA